MQTDSNEIKYPYMPEGRSILFVPEADVFMQEAYKWRDKSNEKQYPTGAVAVKNGVVLGGASNMQGYTHPVLIEWHKKWMCVRRWIKAKSGTMYWICPGCAKSHNHAESGLVLKAEKAGKLESLKDADLYLAGHWWCCKPCWDNMIRAGIRNVYLVQGAKEKFETRKWHK